MPLTIPPIYVDIALREYEPTLGERFARVWVNPSLSVVRERGDLARETMRILQADLPSEERMAQLEALRPRRHAWLVSVLGHGEDAPERWTPDAAELDGNYEASPDFVRWLSERVSAALDEHLKREKKA